MCYIVFLSTTSPADLSLRGSEPVAFKPADEERDGDYLRFLEFPHKWEVLAAGGSCGCGFRHLMSDELGFGEPEEWYRESTEALNSTKVLYSTIERLLLDGFAVDLLDAWEGNSNEIKSLDVSFDLVSQSAFRLFENFRF